MWLHVINRLLDVKHYIFFYVCFWDMMDHAQYQLTSSPVASWIKAVESGKNSYNEQQAIIDNLVSEP